MAPRGPCCSCWPWSSWCSRCPAVPGAAARGTLKAGATSFQAGRLKTLRVEGDNILLGTPFTFTKDNVDRFDF